jgi:hypothetical protein
MDTAVLENNSASIFDFQERFQVRVEASVNPYKVRGFKAQNSKIYLFV